MIKKKVCFNTDQNISKIIYFCIEAEIICPEYNEHYNLNYV